MRGHYSNSEHYPSSVITHKLLRETPGLESLRLPCPGIHNPIPLVSLTSDNIYGNNGREGAIDRSPLGDKTP